MKKIKKGVALSSVQEQQSKAAASIAAAINKFSGPKSMLRKATGMVGKVRARSHSGACDVIANVDDSVRPVEVAMRAVTTQVASLKEKSSTVRRWTKDTMAEDGAAVERLTQELVESDAALGVSMVALERTVQETRAIACKTRKAEPTAAKKAMKGWLAMGLPSAMAAAPVDIGLLGKPDSNTGASAASLLAEDSAPLSDNAASDSASGYQATLVQVTCNVADFRAPLCVRGTESADLASVLGSMHKVLATDLGSRVLPLRNSVPTC